MFNHKKSLGQNFLNNNQIIKNVIDKQNIENNDLVIEIGPGQGIMTKLIKEKNCHLIAFEIDTRLKQYLEPLQNEKTKIIFEDFLKIDLNNYIENNYNNIYVIANLPYYITTPILEKIIDSNINIKKIIIMVQKEVADRFAASPGTREYGSITAYLNYYYKVNKLEYVDRKNFSPIPNVDSQIIELVYNKRQANNEQHLFKLIKESFVHKRKNIKNNLYNYDLKIIEETLKNHNLDLTTRAENINIDLFIEISNNLLKR